MQRLGLALVCAALFAAPARANTSIFTNAGPGASTPACTSTSWCKELSMFGILGGANDVLTLKGNETFNGGVGVYSPTQNGGGLTVTGANTFNSILDFSDPVAAGNRSNSAPPCATGVYLCGAGTINGQTVTASSKPVQDATTLSTAFTQLTNIESNFLNTLTSTAKLPTSGTVNVQSGAGYNSSQHLTVYKNTATYNQSNALTLGCGGTACDANDIVVVLLTSSTSATFKFNVSLADNLFSDQVIFYLPNAGMTVAPTAAAITMMGGFFFGSTSAVTFGSTASNAKAISLVGRVYGPSITFNSLPGTGFTQTDLGVATPEPGTWALWGGGLGALLWLRRRSRRQGQAREAAAATAADCGEAAGTPPART